MNESMKCPECKAEGRYVAAIHYEETTTSNSRGYASGSGVGVGMGGDAGVFAGGGSTCSTSVSQTERAKLFPPPEATISEEARSEFRKGALLFALIPFLSLGYSLSVSDAKTEPHLKTIASALEFIDPPWVFFIGTMIALAVFTQAFFRSGKLKEKMDKVNNESLPKRIKRYNEIIYCGKCHTLYTLNNESTKATDEGFQSLMNNRK